MQKTHPVLYSMLVGTVMTVVVAVVYVILARSKVDGTTVGWVIGMWLALTVYMYWTTTRTKAS